MKQNGLNYIIIGLGFLYNNNYKKRPSNYDNVNNTTNGFRRSCIRGVQRVDVCET